MRGKKRSLSILMTATLLVSVISQSTLAAGTGRASQEADRGNDVLCEHYLEHDEDCGYTVGGGGNSL